MYNLLPLDGEIYLWNDFIPRQDAVDLLDSLMFALPWRTDTIRIYGKEILVPRLTAFYGDAGIRYKYSGLQMEALMWTPILQTIRRQVEEAVNESFNSVLINHYRNGRDYVAWHADNERELGDRPVIAMLSLGAGRILQFRHRIDREKKADIAIPDASLLLMKGDTQEHWLHQLKRQPAIFQPRISLTFRKICR